ncbi:hypothetical protein GOALK_002_00500 [Gordonia alkanivorans NBRC 16433]|jgi:hypothetical protein|uniref:Uncharacterized protein n=1 Tax=Gordonia alkanivorans NBRC 16433 TaxID=1027371 RepID=F9VPP6_9ACTN|nr:hypothetical protein GOALK_002_00500 [Gordonia alkanivorans NBRC 16433]
MEQVGDEYDDDFEMTDEEFDRRMEAAEPVRLVPGPREVRIEAKFLASGWGGTPYPHATQIAVHEPQLEVTLIPQR